jgi:hypothetical protein
LIHSRFGGRLVTRCAIWVGVAAIGLALCVGSARGGDIFGHVGLSGGSRWDAAPRLIGANERSLNGGLRYSLDGGSFQAYRDLFQWNVVPSVADFTTAVQQAFAAWTSVDPATNLGTALAFTPDLGTAVVGNAGFGGVNVNGAEIDLLARTSRSLRERPAIRAPSPFPAPT